MKVRAGYQEPLAERIEQEQSSGNNIFTYFEAEHLKVYDKFQHNFVSDILRIEKLRTWQNGGYFIVSQTGTGKSTLIVNQVAEIARERNKRVLLIVPRVALAMQYKKEFAELYCRNLLEELTDRGIKKRSHWGPADIYVMQELTNTTLMKELIQTRTEYDFVVIDEVHAFVGDAAFNPYSEEIFRFLIQNIGQEVKRLYLTATPEIVLEEVVNMEKGVKNREDACVTYLGLPNDEICLTMFRFEFDYQYVQPIFFEKESEPLVQLKKLSEDEKAVIFVHSRAQGMRICEELGRDKSVYIDAKNKMNDEFDTFSAIVNENKFPQKFLVVTKFLDVGVNLKDLKIKNVVMFTFYKEEVLQMLGRKRVAQNETLKLYIRVPTDKEIRKELEQIEVEESEMKREEGKFSGNYSGYFRELPKPLFIVAEGGRMECHCNHFAYALNWYHKTALKKYLEGGTNRIFFDNFQQTILGWLPGHQEAQKCESVLDAVVPLNEEIEAILGPLVLNESELMRDEMIILCNNLLDILKVPRRGDQKEHIPISILKREFGRLNIYFKIINLSKRGKNGVWKIERGEWE